jgi:hypothetical protein
MSSESSTMSLRDTILVSAGQDFHDIIVSPHWRHPNKPPPSAETIARARDYLDRVKSLLFANVASFPATPHLEKLYAAQRNVVAQCGDTLAQIAGRFVDAVTPPNSFRRVELHQRVSRASTSALKKLHAALFEASQNTDAGKDFLRVSKSVDRLLGAAKSIEDQIALRGDDADPEWLDLMRAKVAENRAAAELVAKADAATDGADAAASDIKRFEDAWMATQEYTLYAEMGALLEQLYAVEPLDALHDTAYALMNTGKLSVESGDAFEARVARSVRDIVELCGFDGDWFDECERANGTLERAKRDSTDAPWIDQSQSAHSIRCGELGKRNLRVEFNLPLYVPEKRKTGDVVVASGEVDGLVYDARTNEVLIWIEAKAHAPDLPKADAQREQLLRKLFVSGGFVSRERSKVPWFSAANFARFQDPAVRALNSVIATRPPPPDCPIRVPSYVTVHLQRAVWADDDEHLLDQLDSIRMAVRKQDQRSPKQIVQYYESFNALDRIKLLPFDERPVA